MEASSWLLRLADQSEPVAYAGMLVPCMIGLWRWSQLPASLRALTGLAGFMALHFGLLKLAGYLWRENMIVGHLSGVGETIFYLLAFRHALRLSAHWFYSLLVAFLLFAALDSFVLEGFGQLNSYTLALESFLGISFALLYFEQELHKPAIRPILERPFTVACIGIILYLAGTIMVYSLSNHFVATNDSVGNTLLYSVNNIMLFVLSGFLTQSFLLSKLPAGQPTRC
ncbi:hypothetical protein [Hymenobacter sublimis]|uniref:Uncharacterized protein n=1 Tax=Hymenobacter sublimis TaxID=2933777 RepID=A0ABY4JDT9_9BACT|nr:hypothetical protein [Hymenobacter sublimis]UPL49952.1 hypothetical protein MWH26_03345 [Hymenobacter sublimis]